MNTILTQKLTVALELQAHDGNGNPALVFQQGEQPTNVYQSGIVGPLTVEFATLAIEKLQELKADLEAQLNKKEEEAAVEPKPE